MSYQSAAGQQMLLQQLQGMMGQMAGLMQQASVLSPQIESASPAANAPASTIQKKEPRQIRYVHGLDEAKEEQRNLGNGESDVLMDDENPLFYMIMKDKDGKSPRKLTICRFTIEDEPDPPKYVTQDDLAAFKQDIIDAIKGETK